MNKVNMIKTIIDMNEEELKEIEQICIRYNNKKFMEDLGEVLDIGEKE